MILQIPIQEAISLIKEKSGKTVSLKVVNNNTIKAGYVINKKVPILGNISKEIDVDLVFDRVADNKIFLHYSTGIIGGDKLLDTLLSILPSFTNSNIVERSNDAGIIIHLEEIEQIKNAIDVIDLKSIFFEADKILTEFAIKK